MTRVETGIKVIDEMLKGGVPENSCILLSGEPGTGKSFFTQKIVNNCLKKGYSVIFITTDRSPERLIKEVSDKGMDYNQFVDEGRLLILNLYSGYVSSQDKKFYHADIRNLTDISIEIDRLRKKLSGSKVIEVYDVISELFVWNNNKDLVMRFISSACSKGSNSSSALYFVLNEGILNESYTNSIKSIMDGIIQFGVMDDSRWFKVAKMTSTSVKSKKINFNITSAGKLRII